MFAKGMTFNAVFILLFFALVWVMITRAKGGQKIPKIRKLAGLDAIDEALGRATEMGRPLHYSPGMNQFDAPTFAGMAVMGHVAQQAARYNTRLIVTVRRMLMHPIAQEMIKQAYLEMGRPESYNPEDVRWVSDDQFSYSSAVMGILQRENVAANLLIGYWMAESLVVAESGFNAGAIQIAGTTNTYQIAFFVASCDYTLIGEEIYAAGAYLSKEPVLTGTVIAQDWAKMAILALILIGTVMANLGTTAKPLIDLLTK
jgi:hypothetical protein